MTFLPYLTGERTPHLDASLTGRWVGLRPGTGRPELIRSVFEGVALALRDWLDALRTAGHTIDQALLAEDPLNFHPLDNTMTTTIAKADLLRFADALGHAYEAVDLKGAAPQA